uniref:Uncharacterized protein n=1 Tax=Rhizophora mucronata TaxID=61149 RepID=A0A2P2N278_RHIMU
MLLSWRKIEKVALLVGLLILLLLPFQVYSFLGKIIKF